jgi:hypothetical protein
LGAAEVARRPLLPTNSGQQDTVHLPDEPLFVARQLGMTPQGAVNLLRRLEGIGALRGDSPGQGLIGRWYADDVLAILEP